MTDARKIEKQIEDLKKQLADLTEEEMGEMEEKGSEYLQAMKERGRAMAEKARMARDRANEFAHENPWALMGIGVAAGLIIGMVVSKKIRCRCER